MHFLFYRSIPLGLSHRRPLWPPCGLVCGILECFGMAIWCSLHIIHSWKPSHVHVLDIPPGPYTSGMAGLCLLFDLHLDVLPHSALR